jgi:TRAP-type C4-dicarboxylate transport system substrate-binding protein
MRSLILSLMLCVSTAASAQVVIKLGTVAPDGSPWHKKLKELGEIWEKDSGGQVKLKIYPGGVAGDESDMVRKMRVGQLQAAAITVLGLREVDPAVQAMGIPGMATTEEEVQCLMEKVTPSYTKKLADKGFVVLSWGDTGWAYFFTQKEVRMPADAKGLKIFTWAGDPGASETWRKAGFQPVVLSVNDLTTSLVTGMIDSFANNPIMAFTARWYERVKYMADVPWGRLIGATVISKDAWEKIPADLRPKLAESGKKIGVDVNQAVQKMGTSAIKAMEKNGLKVTKLNDAERKAWFELAESTWPVIRGSVVPPDAFDQVKKAREDCRAKK